MEQKLRENEKSKNILCLQQVVTLLWLAIPPPPFLTNPQESLRGVLGRTGGGFGGKGLRGINRNGGWSFLGVLFAHRRSVSA
jgi:hypothetical protein